MTSNEISEIQQRIDQLTLDEKTKLVNGINMEAAYILKKILPNSAFLDKLITLKSQFSNF